MADQSLFLLSGAIGIGPALFFLWHALRRFDYPRVEKTLFDDRKVFFSLAVGLVLGTMSSVFSLYLRGMDLASTVVVIAGIALFEESFKLAYLNRKGYRTNFATTFYGFALGLGVASTVVLAYGLGNPNLIGPTGLLMIVFSVSFSVTESTTGAMIGYGCSKGIPWSYFIRAVVVRGIYTFAALPFLLSLGPEWLVYTSLFASLAVGLFLYYFAYTETLPETLPPEFRRQIRKAKRARVRAKRS